MTYPVADTEKPSEIVTADYVEDAIADAVPAGVLPRPLIYVHRVQQQDITTSGYTVIAWDNRVINTGTVLATNGDITIPADGNYLLHINLLFEAAGNIGANNTRTIFDVVVSKYANSTFTDFGNLIYENESSTAGAWRSRRIGWRFLAGVFAGDTFNVRAKMGGGLWFKSGSCLTSCT
ncbi:hypothetical protein [Scytonema sp. HK-05]|uniref:hypothetical protein n=1 Tax=Scytonema sp. HK-05 TaxID=1137095 RepID=UPI0011614778|nr:hypothetical protein [Scytonema sp. HK-05]